MQACTYIVCVGASLAARPRGDPAQAIIVCDRKINLERDAPTRDCTLRFGGCADMARNLEKSAGYRIRIFIVNIVVHCVQFRILFHFLYNHCLLAI